jgi:hydroxymethylbilane synthase
VPDPDRQPLRVGTRASALALAQAAAASTPLGDFELVEITTSGDRGEAGDKSRFVDGLESALREERIDLAVHSAKDLPGEEPSGLEIVATGPREDPSDAIVTRADATTLDELPEGSRVGTSSLRRRAQLLARRPDLVPVELRGNVDTRLDKLAAGEVDALILASAGLKRLGRGDEISFALDPHTFTPSPGQGTVAFQSRGGDPAGERAAAVGDRTSHLELSCERTAARRLGASCDSSVGILATCNGELIEARAWCGLPDGSDWISDSVEGDSGDPTGLGERVAERLLSAGAGEILERSASMAAGEGS